MACDFPPDIFILSKYLEDDTFLVSTLRNIEVSNHALRPIINYIDKKITIVQLYNEFEYNQSLIDFITNSIENGDGLQKINTIKRNSIMLLYYYLDSHYFHRWNDELIENPNISNEEIEILKTKSLEEYPNKNQKFIWI